MTRINRIPAGSSIEREIRKGRIYTRTGKRGQATILYDSQGQHFVVMVGKEGPRVPFSAFPAALRRFRMAAGV